MADGLFRSKPLDPVKDLSCLWEFLDGMRFPLHLVLVHRWGMRHGTPARESCPRLRYTRSPQQRRVL